MVEVVLVAKQRKTVALEEKLDAIRTCERNEHTANVVNATGIPELSLRTIRKEADKIKERCESVTRITASKFTQIRAPILDKLERMLLRWTAHQHQSAIPPSSMIIQTKSRSLFDNLNAIGPNPKVPVFCWLCCVV